MNDLLNGVTTFLGGVGGTAALLTPGYIMGKVYGRGVRAPEATGTAFVAAAAIGGIVTHVLMLFWTVPLARSVVRALAAGPDLKTARYVELALWALVVLLLVPTLLGAFAAWLGDRSSPRWLARVLDGLGLSSALRTGEAWNWVFRGLAISGSGAWVRVRLKDDEGAVIGKFGPQSLASSDAQLRDFYLEEIWTADRDGRPLRPAGAALWLNGADILAIEFYPTSQGAGDAQEGLRRARLGRLGLPSVSPRPFGTEPRDGTAAQSPTLPRTCRRPARSATSTTRVRERNDKIRRASMESIPTSGWAKTFGPTSEAFQRRVGTPALPP